MMKRTYRQKCGRKCVSHKAGYRQHGHKLAGPDQYCRSKHGSARYILPRYVFSAALTLASASTGLAETLPDTAHSDAAHSGNVIIDKQNEAPPSNTSHTTKQGRHIVQKGMASWYRGLPFHRHHVPPSDVMMTAAHRSLPFGTRLLVHSHKTGRSVIVRVTDRGPYIKNRIIDLSRPAAAQLGILGAGVSSVTIKVLKRNDDLSNSEVAQLPETSLSGSSSSGH